MGKKFLVVSSMYFFFVNGSILLFVNSILVFIVKEYGLVYGQVGMLLTVQAVASIITNYFSTHIAQSIGFKRTLIIAAYLFAAGMGIVSMIPSIAGLSIGLIVIGIAWGCSNNIVNFVLITETDGNPRIISLVHLMFAVGAFISPLSIAAIVGSGYNWRISGLAITFVSVGLAVISHFMPIKNSYQTIDSVSEIGKTQNNLFKNPRLYIYMILLFLYVGIEVGSSGWIVSYLTNEKSAPIELAQSMLSVLWISIVAGRALIVWLSGKFKPSALMIVEMSGAFIGIMMLIFAPGLALNITGVVLLGFSLASFYSMVIADAAGLISGAAKAGGALMAVGGAGASVIPLAAGIVADAYDMKAGFIFIMFLIVITLGVAVHNNIRRA